MTDSGVDYSNGNFYGLRTGVISNGTLSVEYLLDAGPRITRLRYMKGENILAELPELSVDTEFGPYFFRGGHRLWHAPENIPRTYIPDNEPITETLVIDGTILTQSVECRTGIQKSIHITFGESTTRVTLSHILLNKGMWPVTLSAWGITQLPLGGIAILPQTNQPSDSLGILPNRNLALWSYSSIRDKRLHLADDFILVQGASILPPLKIGYANSKGWIAYHRNTTLFVKHFSPQNTSQLPDLGCDTEIYCGDQFIELETLSPITTVDPGQSIYHIETWEIIPDFPPLTTANISSLNFKYTRRQ